MRFRRLFSPTRMSIIALLAMGLFGSNVQADMVTNGSFEHPEAGGQTFFNGHGAGGNAAAMGWTVFNNTSGSTETEHMLYGDALLPPIFPGDPGAGGDHVIRVETSGDGNGIVQVMAPFNSGPPRAIGEAWVYVNSGTVGAGVGNGGGTVLTSFASALPSNNGWQKLTFSELGSTSPVNEVVFTPTVALQSSTLTWFPFRAFQNQRDLDCSEFWEVVSWPDANVEAQTKWIKIIERLRKQRASQFPFSFFVKSFSRSNALAWRL